MLIRVECVTCNSTAWPLTSGAMTTVAIERSTDRMWPATSPSDSAATLSAR